MIKFSLMAEQFHFCEEIAGAGAEKQFTRVTQTWTY
jgi:hypothetical protein